MADYIFETKDLVTPVVLYVEGSGGTFLGIDRESGHPYKTSFSGARWFGPKEDVAAIIKAAEQTNSKIRILQVSELKFEDITVARWADTEYERELAALKKKYNRA